MARQRDYRAEYARRAAKQAAAGTTYSRERYKSEKASAQAQGFTSPKAARKAGAKLSAGVVRQGARPPRSVQAGGLTLHRLDGPSDLGALRRATEAMPGATPVVLSADFMGKSGPVRVFVDATLDYLRGAKFRRIVEDLTDQADSDYGGSWGDQVPSNIQAAVGR